MRFFLYKLGRGGKSSETQSDITVTVRKWARGARKDTWGTAPCVLREQTSGKEKQASSNRLRTLRPVPGRPGGVGAGVRGNAAAGVRLGAAARPGPHSTNAWGTNARTHARMNGAELNGRPRRRRRRKEFAARSGRASGTWGARGEGPQRQGSARGGHGAGGGAGLAAP